MIFLIANGGTVIPLLTYIKTAALPRIVTVIWSGHVWASGNTFIYTLRCRKQGLNQRRN